MSTHLFFLFHRFNVCLCLQAGKTDPSVFANTDINHNSFFTFLNVTHYVYDSGIPGTSFGNLLSLGLCKTLLAGSCSANFVQVLLSRDEMLQLSGVQCVAEVLAHHPQYGQVLLKADIAGT